MIRRISSRYGRHTDTPLIDMIASDSAHASTLNTVVAKKSKLKRYEVRHKIPSYR